MPRNKFFKDQGREVVCIPRETREILEKAWNDLPSDLTFSERFLFIELAQRLIKLAGVSDSQAN